MQRSHFFLCALVVPIISGSAAPAAAQVGGPGSPLEGRIASTIREAGEVQSASNVEVRCLVPGVSTVLFVVPEGTAVKEGDLLAEFDSAPLQEQLSQQRLAVQRASAALNKEERKLATLSNRGRRLTEIQKLQEKSAELARRAVLADGGELDVQRRAAEGELKIAEARLAAAKAARAAERQTTAGAAELELEVLEANERLEAAARQIELVARFRERETAALELEHARQRLEIEDLIGQERSHLEEMVAGLEIAKQARDEARDGLRRLEESLKHCRLHAPSSGTVVYNNRPAGRGATAGFVLEPGATVRERQTILLLPDLSKLQVRTLVNETRIPQVQVGQAAKIVLDALPEQQFSGTVVNVSRTAAPSTFLNSQVKQYEVLVDLVERPEFARIGMSAMVEIDASKAPARRRP